MPFRALTFLAFAFLFLAGCGDESNGAIQLAFIGDEADLSASGPILPSPARHIRAATHAGLVALDAKGEVIPALADRWIVTEDGKSYIFRLRDAPWPGGDELTGQSVRTALRDAIRELRDTPLGLDLEKIAEVRAMAGRVIEIRLKSPMPDFLQLLAQPELALNHDEIGTGPMLMRQEGDLMLLEPRSPAERGIPFEEDWRERIRLILVTASPAEKAVQMFYQGQLDAVFGGRIGSIPFVNTGPLSRGTVQLDPALGLFGLQVRRAEGLLATAQGREALAMAIDRAALLEPFAIGGWTPTTRIVGAGVTDDFGAVSERWQGIPTEQRRFEAARRVAAWSAADSAEGGVPQKPRLTIALGVGPGLDRLFAGLQRQFAGVGIELERVEDEDRADLVLLDRTARYAGVRWFLNQFNCSVVAGPCAPEADARVEESLTAPDAGTRAMLLAQAEAELTEANVYIPLAQPLRWSLVRGGSRVCPESVGVPSLA